MTWHYIDDRRKYVSMGIRAYAPVMGFLKEVMTVSIESWLFFNFDSENGQPIQPVLTSLDSLTH